ncbi:SDR family oxidoreductase [Microbacterium jejuense]|uniref:SDR family oxidoreductase n=1 Tax=Microbacterium jejuense TaxID=1263637 RepID=A0ABS7HJI9_9MICO|nr:SDR family oxidoreductase [Microbacterium jejuense]MBW9093067.1 SDR family oxidoreductase [Microbacterium jejuense]
MDLQLAGGIAAVTGAASGIGRATAHYLAGEGVAVGLLDRDLPAAESVAAEINDAGGSAVAIQVDVSDEGSVERAMAQVAYALGGLDYLVLCAGISTLFGKAVDEIDASQWDREFGVNVRGQWLPVKYALPALRASSREPAISIVASDSALFAAPLNAAYEATKAAVLMLTKALAVDLRPDGIRVNCVCPSVVDTPQSRGALGIPEGGYAGIGYPVHSPEDIARYLTLLISPVTRTINAHPLVADFGYSAQSNFPA